MADASQFRLSTPNLPMLAYVLRQAGWHAQVVTQPLEIACSHLRPPAEPGLGIGELEEAVARAHTGRRVWRCFR